LLIGFIKFLFSLLYGTTARLFHLTSADALPNKIEHCSINHTNTDNDTEQLTIVLLGHNCLKQ